MKGKLLKKILFIICLGTLFCAMAHAQPGRAKNPMDEISRLSELSNSVTALTNAYTLTYEHYDSMIRKAQEQIKQRIENPDFIVTATLGIDTVSVGDDLYKRYQSRLDAVPDNLKDKEGIIKAVDAANNGVKQMFASAHALNYYFKERQYENDDEVLSVFNNLCNDLLVNTDMASKLWRNASRTAATAANYAENVLLLQSRNGEFYVSVKNSMFLLRILTEDAFDDEKYIDWKDIKDRCTSISSLFGQARDNNGLDMDKLKKQKKLEFYTYYDMGIDLLKNISILADLYLGKASESKKYDASETVRSDYRKVVGNYNTFMASK